MVEFGDDEIGFGGKELSMEQLVMRHLSKISDISCKELTSSYTEKRPVKVGEGMMLIEKYYPDMREGYCNAVDFLLDLILPYGDEEFAKEYKEIKEGEEEEWKDATEKKIKGDEWMIIKLKLRRNLFSKINIMLYRINFFSGGGNEIHE